MEAINLTRQEARKIILNAAGLARKAQFGTGIEAVYQAIDHLGFVQLDTNYVVERAHHHVMAARIPDYQPQWLADLCDDCSVFEYFASDAGYIPMHDFRFTLTVKNAFKNQRKPLTEAEVNLAKQILDRVKREERVMVGDFENDRIEASTGWWDWRPAKVALERLYLEGDLMISRTNTFKKVYGLPLDFVPQETDLTLPSDEEYARYIIVRTLGALGISTTREMAWRASRVKNNLIKSELQKMVETGEVKMVVVDDLKGPHYVLPKQKFDIEITNEVFILSPFDVLNVFRHRLKDFFNFDYQIECFVPAAKRKYGYFSLPIISGDKFIARMDAKADRKKKVLIVHNIHFERGDIDPMILEKLVQALKAFIRFNQCKEVVLNRSNNDTYLETLSGSFS